MSMLEFAYVWHTSPAKGTTLLVHLALADRAIDGVTQVPQEELASMARCVRTTVDKALTDLEEMGAIKTLRPTSGKRAATFKLLGLPEIYASDRMQQEYAHKGLSVTTIDSKTADSADPDFADLVTQVYQEPILPPIYPTPPPSIVGIPDFTPPPPVSPPQPAPVATDAVREVLAALKVKERPDTAYWFRVEHIEDYRAALRGLGINHRKAIELIALHQIAAPDLRKMSELTHLLAPVTP